MAEYFIVAHSFAAPFFSDKSTHYAEGATSEGAFALFQEQYDHPCRLYAADMFHNADEYHKGNSPVLRWICNQARFIAGLPVPSSILVRRPGVVTVNGEAHTIDDPYGGDFCSPDEELKPLQSGR